MSWIVRCLVGIVVVVVVVVLLRARRREPPIPQLPPGPDEPQPPKPPTDDRLDRAVQFLATRIDAYEPQILAYYIHDELCRAHASNDVRDRLYERHGKILGKPILDIEGALPGSNANPSRSDVLRELMQRRSLEGATGRVSLMSLQLLIDQRGQDEARRIVETETRNM